MPYRAHGLALLAVIAGSWSLQRTGRVEAGSTEVKDAAEA